MDAVEVLNKKAMRIHLAIDIQLPEMASAAQTAKRKKKKKMETDVIEEKIGRYMTPRFIPMAG